MCSSQKPTYGITPWTGQHFGKLTSFASRFLPGAVLHYKHRSYWFFLLQFPAWLYRPGEKNSRKWRLQEKSHCWELKEALIWWMEKPCLCREKHAVLPAVARNILDLRNARMLQSSNFLMPPPRHERRYGNQPSLFLYGSFPLPSDEMNRKMIGEITYDKVEKKWRTAKIILLKIERFINDRSSLMKSKPVRLISRYAPTGTGN